ncbi:alpha/beta hydrolase [Vreelandella populi]|uniref:Alpha/beta hydrolase n=1 Tax=Vreelandella populi TaxID=2498858 RepID=A0A433LA78_9GAMM|nr:alpha/beta hydrolase [Halomonas populi]RUR36509.1 alpha/beta hydrolase [Halomonas populi]RUR44970.1 alpha/beta hydrolase [Halomonas populi]RUR51307.1 alpha/beta hydrolase [Halomonas populi]
METSQDLAYSPSHFARDFEATLARQAAAGRELAERHPPIALNAGDAPAACFNLFIPKGEGPWPLMVFIHGGYWQELSNTATDFLAERYLARGMAFASLGYGLAPTTSIETMVAQCIEGLEEAYHALTDSGGVWSIRLSGHSAGAQLAYWVATSGRVPIDKLVLVSGVYDLTPLVDTYVNEPLGLNLAQARALSPLFGELAQLPPCQVVIAENDPPTFRKQGHDFVTALRAANVKAELLDLPACDHFDVLDYL